MINVTTEMKGYGRTGHDRKEKEDDDIRPGEIQEQKEWSQKEMIPDKGMRRTLGE